MSQKDDIDGSDALVKYGISAGQNAKLKKTYTQRSRSNEPPPPMDERKWLETQITLLIKKIREEECGDYRVKEAQTK